MTPFAWLCLAHLVGDWLLQNDWMAREKRGRWMGAACLLHCTIYTTTLTVAFLMIAWPWTAATSRQGLLFASAIFLSHWLIDGFNLPQRWNQLIGQSSSTMVRTVVDQTMHLLVLAVLVQWL